MKRKRDIVAIASECAKSLAATVKIAEMVKQFQYKNAVSYFNKNAAFLGMAKNEYPQAQRTIATQVI
jgi:hypothetical protein